MGNMPLNNDDREDIESSIIDAQIAAERYLETAKDVHKSFLVMSVLDTLDIVRSLSDKLQDDPKRENYKLHLLVPTQLYYMIENDSE